MKSDLSHLSRTHISLTTVLYLVFVRLSKFAPVTLV